MYVLPSNTNCVHISDLIFSLVKTPICVYIGGQDVTHNYTPINMLSGLCENDCLYFIYCEKYEKPKNSLFIEDYIKEKNVDVTGPAKIILKPFKKSLGPVQKLKVWDDCTVKQLQLILEKRLNKRILIYDRDKLIEDDTTVFQLRNRAKIDGVIHLVYEFPTDKCFFFL
jgi:Fe-S cluster biosynthesis and repair protein YggX